MESIAVTLSNLFGPAWNALVLGVVFIAVTLLGLALMRWLMGGIDPVQRRLQTIASAEKPDAHVEHKEGAFFVRIVEPAVKLIMPKEGWDSSRLQTRMVRAGYHGPQAGRTFIGNKLLLALLLPALFFLLMAMAGNLLPVNKGYTAFLLGISALVGYYLPDLIVLRRTNRRKLLFTESFPDAMDMFVVCVEAGLGLDATIQRVGEEMDYSHPELAAEFKLLSLELRAGKSREEALRALAYRMNIEEVQELVTLLIQAEHFGTSIAKALRLHAAEMRALRTQKARERAAKLPVKLVFPIIFFIFPALFLVVLGPAAISIYQALIGTFSGH